MHGSLLLCCALVGQVPQAERIDSEFLKYRERIKSGNLTMNVEVSRPNENLVEKWHTEIWFADGRYRCDYRFFDNPNQSRREVYCENCERSDYYVHFDEKCLTLQRMKPPGGGARLGDRLKFDPRILGICISSPYTFDSIRLHEMVGRSDRKNVSVESADWQGKKSWRVSYELANGAQVSDLFVPEMGHCLVERHWAYSVMRDGGKVEMLHIVKSEPKEQGKAKLWFPHKVECRKLQDGMVVDESRMTSIEANFNEPVSAELFKVSGMKVPPKTRASYLVPGAEGRYYWDGKAFVKEQIARISDVPSKDPGSGGGSKWLAGAAISLACLGLGAFGVYWLRRRALAGRRTA